MNRYANQTLSFGSICKNATRLHYLTLKHTITCILFITIAKYVATLLMTLFSSEWMQVIIDLIALAAMGYFLAVALFLTHQAFIDKPVSTKNALVAIWQRIVPILITLFAYVIGAVIIYFVMKFILIAIQKLIGDQTDSVQQGIMLIAGLFSLVFIMMFYFSFAISVIDNKPFNKAFYDAAILGEKEKTAVLILFVLSCAVLLLLTPGMISEYFLAMYHLDAVFDFVVLCVAVPLYINLLLLSIHNAKQHIS